jgi:excisionase family DNA binding protein
VFPDLLIRPAALHGEHRLGYFLRLAELNGLKSVGWLSSRALTDDSSDVAIRTWRYARHCPACLRETGVWRDDWTLALLPFCERHGSWLTDSCWRCRRKLVWTRMRLPHVQCGADLCDTATVPLAGTLRDIVAARTDPNAVCDKIPPELVSLALPELARLFMAIGGTYAFPRTPRAKRKLCRSDLKQCAKVAMVASEHLVPWPDAIRKDLDELLRRRSRTTPEPLATTFARLYRPLHRELDDPPFDFLRAEFDGFIAQWWPEPITRRHRAIQASNANVVLPMAVAARKQGARAATLLRMCRAARIAPRVRKASQGARQQRTLATADLERLDAWTRELITVREAAQVLGISRPRVRELVRAGELRALVARPSGAKLERASLLSWSNELLKRARPIASTQALVDFGHALRFLLPRGQLPSIIRAFADKQLHLYFTGSRPERLGALLINRERLCDFLESDPIGCWLTIPEVARRLRVKQEVAYALVRHHRLPSRARRVKMRTCQVVSDDALDQFNARYISAVKLARAHGTSPRAVVCRLRRAGIQPVTGPAVDGCRQAFYLRRKIPRGALSGPGRKK